jgi:hypothetical protein
MKALLQLAAVSSTIFLASPEQQDSQVRPFLFTQTLSTLPHLKNDNSLLFFIKATPSEYDHKVSLNDIPEITQKLISTDTIQNGKYLITREQLEEIKKLDLKYDLVFLPTKNCLTLDQCTAYRIFN